MELYIFRHGEKEKEGYFIGQTDVGLTAKGRRQNKEIEKKLLKFNAEKVFTSDLKRTFIKQGVKKKTLREIDFGDWEGLLWSEIERAYPQKAARYLANPLNFRFPEGESYIEFKKRILRWMEKLCKMKLQRVGMVVHRGVICVVVSHFRGDNFWKIKTKPGGGIRIKIPPF